MNLRNKKMSNKRLRTKMEKKENPIFSPWNLLQKQKKD